MCGYSVQNTEGVLRVESSGKPEGVNWTKEGRKNKLTPLVESTMIQNTP